MPASSPRWAKIWGQTHVLHGDVVKLPHRARGLLGNLPRVDVGVGVRRPVGYAIVKHRHDQTSSLSSFSRWRWALEKAQPQ